MLDYIEQSDGSLKRTEVPSAVVISGTVVGDAVDNGMQATNTTFKRPLVPSAKLTVWGVGTHNAPAAATVTEEGPYKDRVAQRFIMTGVTAASPPENFTDNILEGAHIDYYPDNCFVGAFIIDPSITCPSFFNGIYPIVQSFHYNADSRYHHIYYITSNKGDSPQIFSGSDSFEIAYYSISGGFTRDVHIGSNITRLRPGVLNGNPELFIETGNELPDDPDDPGITPVHVGFTLGPNYNNRGNHSTPLGASISTAVEFHGTVPHLPRRMSFMLMGS